MDEWKLPPFTIEQMVIPFAQLIDWGVKDAGLPDLWTEFGKGAGVKVCILDTGQPTHKDLISGLTLAKDFTNSSRGVADNHGHATHCNGIVGARDNETAVVGVAPECELMNGKVLGDNGSGSATSIAAGIDWALSNNADVISMSLGSPSPSDMILSAINRIPPHVILVCAAGNSGPGISFDYPGAWERALSIASHNQGRKISQFSTRNQFVDVAAPGERITSTWLNDQVATLNGTSMATPYVAGIAALVIGYCRKTHRIPPTHGQFASLLENSVDDVGPSGPDIAAGYGLVSPRRVLEHIKLIPANPPTQPPPETLWEVLIRGTGQVPAVFGP